MHPLNASSPIVVKLDSSPNKTFSNFEHPPNAPPPIESTEEGIEIDFNSMHANASSPIFVKLDSSPNKTFSNFEHPSNALTAAV